MLQSIGKQEVVALRIQKFVTTYNSSLPSYIPNIKSFPLTKAAKTLTENVYGQTDGRTDGQTDGQTEKVITIGLLHFQCRALMTYKF